MGVHDGHRERMRQRFIDYGGQNLNSHELIEMLLYYAYPRIDTNEKAHKILDEYNGSVTRLVNSDPKSIADNCGISLNAATLFSLIGEINRRMAIEKWNKHIVLDKTSISGEYAVSYLDNLNIEKLYVVCLNSSMAVIKCVEISGGTVDSVYVDVRKVVELALRNGATSVILMHNHPSGTLMPSFHDINFTANCLTALATINVVLEDHIIVANGKYLSFKAEKLLHKEGEHKNER